MTKNEASEVREIVEEIGNILNDAIDKATVLAAFMRKNGDSRIAHALHSYMIPHLESWADKTNSAQCGGLADVLSCIDETEDECGEDEE